MEEAQKETEPPSPIYIPSREGKLSDTIRQKNQKRRKAETLSKKKERDDFFNRLASQIPAHQRSPERSPVSKKINTVYPIQVGRAKNTSQILPRKKDLMPIGKNFEIGSPTQKTERLDSADLIPFSKYSDELNDTVPFLLGDMSNTSLGLSQLNKRYPTGQSGSKIDFWHLAATQSPQKLSL